MSTNPQRGRGGPPGQGRSTQMPSRGPPPSSGRPGIYLAGQPVARPDARITAIEDALVKVTRERTFGIGKNNSGALVPGRRSYGTQGDKIVLRTNYFVISTAYEENVPNMERTWYMYTVEITPKLSKAKRRRLFNILTSSGKFRDIDWATDYAEFIVTTKELDLGNQAWEATVTLPPEGDSSQGNQEGQVPAFIQAAQARNRVRFRVQRKDAFTLRHLIDYLRSTVPGAAYQGRVDIITLFNIIMCKAPNTKANIVSVRQNKFYPYEPHPGEEKSDLGGGLQAMRGYYSSVRPAVGRLLVNLNVTSGAFYKPLAVLDLMSEFKATTNQQREVFLKYLKVQAVYKRDREREPYMNKVKTIVGFAKQPKDDKTAIPVKRFGNAHEIKFRYSDHDGPVPRERELTVYEYFRTVRGITLRFPTLPVLNVGTAQDPQYIPPEICTVLPGQSYKQVLGGDQTTEMLKFAARAPNLNAISITTNGVRLFRLGDPQMNNIQAQTVKPFGFSVGVDMLTVPGRVLKSPQVTYKSQEGLQPTRGSWNLIKQKFVEPARLAKWQVLVINLRDTDALRQSNEPLFRKLESELKGYGLVLGSREPTQEITLDQLTLENRSSNNRVLVRAFNQAQQRKVGLLLVVLPKNDRWLYARIKYYGDTKFGIHTIDTVGSKLEQPKGQGMYMGNLALKFNIKGGGTNHRVLGTLVAPLDDRTMLMGIDVTHPSPGSAEGAPSIACVVASVDEHLSQWPGSIRTQTGRQEMVSELAAMVGERLALWQRKHRQYPTKIILYRDGVSEGQYEIVLTKELPGIAKAFQQYYGDRKNWPRLAIIIVGKRHHTRFYPTHPQDADRDEETGRGSWNPLPGTVVDRHISGRLYHEFWLQAHKGLQGTARPAHYVVIKDDIGFEADQLEQFTHKLCYLFTRATKAVSICPPAYYADLLCERGRAYLFSTLSENHGSDSSVVNDADESWTGGVHNQLKDSTWYI